MKTKIVPVSLTDSLEKKSMEGNENYIGIDEISITYIQPADTNSSSDEIQTITIKSKTACCSDFDNVENKDGYYFDISIPDGQHWSVDDGKELNMLIEDFKQRLYLITEDGNISNS